MKRKSLLKLLVALGLATLIVVPFTASYAAEETAFDIVIRNGTIIDGTGQPAFEADIAIKNGEIVLVGNVGKGVSAETAIDAEGLIVSPGFIDVHTHVGGVSERFVENYVTQGTTTVLTGMCGNNDWPVADYLVDVNSPNAGPNIATLVGHATIRKKVMGNENRLPTEAELEEMKALVRQAMDEGAFGISSGLAYTPGNYADLNELAALCTVVAEYDGLYSSHIREQSYAVVDSWQEIISTGELSGCRVLVAHSKVIGQDYWGTSVDLIAMLQKAHDEGIDAYADAYPYMAGSTSIVGALIPPWVQAGLYGDMCERLQDPALWPGIRDEIAVLLHQRGGAGAVLITTCGADPSIEKRYLDDISAEWGLDPVDAVRKIVVELHNASAVYFHASLTDQETFYSSPYMAVSSDGRGALYNKLKGKLVHPRQYGSMPRFLRQFVREGTMGKTLEEGIRQMTSLPALIAGITDRGVIAKGMKADITIFDYDTVTDIATYVDPHQFSTGIEYVIINGKVAVDDGRFQDILSGVALYGPGKKAPARWWPAS